MAKSDRFDNRSRKKRERRGGASELLPQLAAHSETHSQVNRAYSIKREKESKNERNAKRRERDYF